MKQAVMCGNSAAAASTQRQHSYGLFLKARWQNSQPARFKVHKVDFCAVDTSVIQKWKLWVLTLFDETDPFVVRAIRRRIHSFILGTDNWVRGGYDRAVVRSKQQHMMLFFSFSWHPTPAAILLPSGSHTPTFPSHKTPLTPPFWSLTSATHGHSPLTYQNS